MDARGGTPLADGTLGATAQVAGTEGSKLLNHPQRAFTAELELAWFDYLDLAFKALPPDDTARAAWLDLDRFSTQWVTATPSSALGWVLGNDIFPEVAATYLALPSPACAPLAGLRIGRYGDTLDPSGFKLTTLALPGDGWRTRHDVIKHLLSRDIQSHGLPSTCEVFGLFAPLLPQPGRDEVASFTCRTCS